MIFSLSAAPTAQNSPELKIILDTSVYYYVTECQRNMTIPFLCVMATFLPFLLLSNLTRNIKVNKKPHSFFQITLSTPSIEYLKSVWMYVIWVSRFWIFFSNGIIPFNLPGRIKPVIVTLVKVKKKIAYITPYLVHRKIAYTICMCHGHFPAKNELRRLSPYWSVLDF